MIIMNILTAVTAAVVTDTIAASLVDGTGTALTTTDLGDTVRLRVTYTVPTGFAAGEFPVAIQIYDVVLSGYSDFRTTYNLYTSNGCINTTAQAALDTDAGITYNAGDSTAGTTHIFDTGLFKAAMFDGPAPKTMYVRFSYAATCLNVDDVKCADHEQYCTNNALTRKKRSAGTMLTMDQQFNHNLRMKRNTPTTGKNGTLSFGVPIKVHTEGATNSLGGSENRGGSDVITDKECKVPDMYWIIAVVLGVLLLCMMAMCVFLVLRLRREQNQNHHGAEKLGHQNSGYRY
ncbi:uncharacterized protein LOC132754174 [Ruditapes philippinarum]|uniref:uncharacterized protein LOC132754174 n=1 Tax=Ruditapes philippinarum TaxID=129788 RepID=UPI00295A7C8D|nr:uncharacterized protein LOC132754174 [Ruditapes philippinarum]